MSQRSKVFTTALLAGVVVALLAGCGRGEGTGGTTTGAVGAASAPRTFPGDLPDPIDDMTDGDLWTATTGLPTIATSTPQERKCGTPAKDCWGMIAAVDRPAPGPSNISANGSVVAILTNLGNAPTGGTDVGAERLYGTEMNAGKRFLLVAVMDGTDWRWQVRVAVDGGTTKPAAMTKDGAWKVCEENAQTDNDHPKGKSAFYKCKKYKPLVAGDSATTVANWMRNDPLAPGWLDCSAGCCTAGQ